MAPRALIIGIGNEFSHDDAAGLFVARMVKKARVDGLEVREESGEGASLLEAWKDHEVVFVVDAIRSCGPVGRVHRFDAGAARLPAEPFRRSTHAFSVPEAVALARALGTLPKRLIVYGIEGRNFEAGQGLSPAVTKATEEVVSRLIQETTRPDAHADRTSCHA